MRILIGTKTEWIILDQLDLEIHVDGQQAVIEEVKEDE